MYQACHAACHGAVDSVDDVAFIRAHGQLADNLALREHGAGGADAHLFLGLCAQCSQVLHLHLQDTRHHV